jgi:ABC-type iron transport system FetAB ATPase subunit
MTGGASIALSTIDVDYVLYGVAYREKHAVAIGSGETHTIGGPCGCGAKTIVLTDLEDE